jgi:hypothetical protein
MKTICTFFPDVITERSETSPVLVICDHCMASTDLYFSLPFTDSANIRFISAIN